MPQQLPLLAQEHPTYITQRDETDRAAALERLRAMLSDPPTYTACPNPFLAEIVAQWQEERRDIRAGPCGR